ncbi:hypothetical protein BU14_0275s0008 [Porphyra umbilicalis]|uniref:Uncharacterized protein n=1 Tax=Porphyra umbilicalis TaxID=2786 RepID=A0A1X6P1A3_PORUM|nr:hypothetical protein BU14_0275s0008 [Porphyra umbilicalis]|eukprot:OSX74649.1 hypothetical protein BU14_0275s0008 [Porphyra umbilicalis]
MTVALAGSPDAYVVSSPALCASHVALRLGADRAIPHCPAHPQDDRPTSRFHVKSLFYSLS